MVYPCLSLLRTTSLSPCTSCIYSTTHVDSQETAWDVFSDSQLGSELCLALSYDSTQGWQLFNWPQKKSNNKNGHNKTLQLDQHQIDQGSAGPPSYLWPQSTHLTVMSTPVLIVPSLTTFNSTILTPEKHLKSYDYDILHTHPTEGCTTTLKCNIP